MGVPPAVSTAALLLVLLAGCSADDDAAVPSTASTAPPPGGSLAPGTLPPDVSSTLPPPADLEQLSAALLGAADIGIPDAWAIRDLDAAIMDDALRQDADPLQGLATCPDGAIRAGDSWIQRTFGAPEQPLDNGMLRVDMIVAIQDAAAFAVQQAALTGCTAVSEASLVEVTADTVEPLAGTPLAPVGPAVAATALTLSAGPSAEVPYPSAYALVVANLDGRTVTAVVGGVDLGVPFADTTRELVGRLLARL